MIRKLLSVVDRENLTTEDGNNGREMRGRLNALIAASLSPHFE
jgi:hypothetical protein